MSKNYLKIYTKPQEIGRCSKWRDLVLLETWTRYWHKGHVERRENGLQLKSRVNQKSYAHIRTPCGPIFQQSLNLQAFALRDTRVAVQKGCRVGQKMSYRFRFC